jgi:hypothetical protein
MKGKIVKPHVSNKIIHKTIIFILYYYKVKIIHNFRQNALYKRLSHFLYYSKVKIINKSMP